MKVWSLLRPETPERERVIVTSYYAWLLEERARCWREGIPEGPEFEAVLAPLREMQMGREVEVPDAWILARGL